MKACRRFVLVAALFAWTVPAVFAGVIEGPPKSVPMEPEWYVLLLSEKQTSVDVQPGDSVPVDIVLDREKEYADLNVAIFDVQITGDGLLFEDYKWTDSHFDTDVPNDGSTRPTDPPSALDAIHFENLTVTGDHLFEEGILLSLSLGVPDDAESGSVYEVTYEHDTLTNGCFFCFFYGEAIGPLTINVVPEPATVVLVGVGGLAALRRRKRPACDSANPTQRWAGLT